MITLICGPMYSGKSTALLQRMERSLYAKRDIFVIRPKKDDRGYFSHNDGGSDALLKLFEKWKGQIEIIERNEISDKDLEEIRKHKEVYVDEYFMIKDIHRLIEVYSQRAGEEHIDDLYFGGLLASSENQLFEEAIKILPYCDKIKKLNGVCSKCGSDKGNFTTYQGKAEKTGDILVGDDDYTCHCFDCRTHE